MEKKQKEPSALQLLLEYAGNRKVLLFLSWMASGISALVGLIPYVCIFLMIQEVVTCAPHFSKASHLLSNATIAIIASLASMLIYFVALMCSHAGAFHIAANIRKALIKHISKLPVGYVDMVGSGKLRRIVNDSAGATEMYLAHQLPDSVSVYVTPVAMLVLLFLFDWRFGLVSLISVVLSFLAMMGMMGPQMAEDMKRYQDSLEEMNKEAVEYIRGMSVVKTFSQTVYSFSRFKNSIDNYYKFCINYTKMCRKPMILFELAINSTFAFLIVLSLILCRGGNVTSDILLNLLFYIIFTPLIATAFTRVMYMSESSMTVKDAVLRFDKVLSVAPLEQPKREEEQPQDASVSFEHVTFRYQPDKNAAIDDMSFSIPGGKTVAFVGPSGSGKSTAASLVSRFWDAQSGTVKIGGVDVRRMTSKTLADTVSYVFQDSRLLKMSIADNVRLTKPDATDEEVKEALHKAQCDDILQKLPDGIHTIIGTDGTYLSGGEQQRIAIARSILKNAPVVVLDEATAFADPENEVLVQRAFEHLSVNKTVILIAHRLTTVQHADCIYVMEKGRIRESGTHEQLLAKHGLYEKMWNNYQQSIAWKVGEAEKEGSEQERAGERK